MDTFFVTIFDEEKDNILFLDKYVFCYRIQIDCLFIITKIELFFYLGQNFI